MLRVYTRSCCSCAHGCSYRDNLITLFEYPPESRKAIYATNAIESLNSVIRKATKRRKLVPNDDSAMEVVYLAIQSAVKKRTMPIRNWKAALNRRGLVKI